MSDELKTDKLIYRVPTFYFTIYTEVKEEPKPKKEEYIIENIAKALEENIECLMKVKKDLQNIILKMDLVIIL